MLRPEAIEMARKRLGLSKEAYAPMPPGPPEAEQMMAQGPPPMDPAMAGGAPPPPPADPGMAPPPPVDPGMDPAAQGAPPPPDPMQMMMEMMDAIGQALMQFEDKLVGLENAVGKIAEIVGAVEPAEGDPMAPPPPEAMPAAEPEAGVPAEAMMAVGPDAGMDPGAMDMAGAPKVASEEKKDNRPSNSILEMMLALDRIK